MILYAQIYLIKNERIQNKRFLQKKSKNWF